MKKLLFALLIAVTIPVLAADKKIVFIAGKPSHRPGEHEHRAGCLLLQSCLSSIPGVTSVVYTNGWPTDAKAFDGTATIVLYSDGAGGHPFTQENHLKTIGALMDKGVGLVLLHFAVEPTKENGQKEFLDWVGGAFEINWSVNPHWEANFAKLPSHPIARGLSPFKSNDEWYFNMRFADGMKGVTPILSAIPDGSTTNRNDGPHENNPAVRQMVARGDIQHVGWAFERANGGRGFGFTGGHFHHNWGNENQRRTVLNAILWTAQIEVPANGVQSTVTAEQLAVNLDDKRDRRP
ncbi:MAG: ThuA domain-containing protein [Verrucomicrobiota bacterium]